MSSHNRSRRRPHRVLTVEQQAEVAAARAAARQSQYPHAPTYRTHLGTHTGPKGTVGPVLKPLSEVTKMRPYELAFAGIAAMAQVIEVAASNHGRRDR